MKNKMLAICAMLVIVFFCMTTVTYLYKEHYPYAMGTSEDGKWEAYYVSTARGGSCSINGLCDGLLLYQGNDTGNIGRIYQESYFDGKKSSWSGYEEIDESECNLSSFEEELIKGKKYYWFEEGFDFDDVDVIRIHITYKEKDVKKEADISIDVKKAREHSFMYQLFGRV